MVLVAKSKKSRQRTARIITLVVLAVILVAGAVTGFVLLGYHVNSLDTVFPNVWAEGIDMSGLTYDEAYRALIDGGYEEGAKEISITINFPFDISFSVTGDDVGLTLDAALAAQTAYKYGKEGSFTANTMTYIKSLMSDTELNELSLPDYDSSIIRELADEYAQIFNNSLFDHDMEINDKEISIVKGTSYVAVTADEVYYFSEMVMRRAIEQHAHIEDRFIPETNPDDTIDLQSVYLYIHEEPVAATYDPLLGDPDSEDYDPVNKGATESKNGKTFDLAIAEEILAATESGEKVVIPIIILEPEITQDQLRDMLFRDLLAERSAAQGSPAARVNNIKLAAEAVDGFVLQPGETFSFNGAVGRRTAERGYLHANAIINGELVPTLGGGICQVSSAIYACVMQTDLETVTRSPHGMRVTYLPGGQDATVAYGTLDYKFKNSSEYPIKLEVTTTGSVTVSVRIYGTRVSEVYYKIESVEHETSPIEMTTLEREVKPEDNIELEPGERRTIVDGRNGQVWEVWRYHYSDPDFENPILDANGNHVRQRVNISTYPMRQRVIIYSTETPTPPPPPPPPTPAPPDNADDPGNTGDPPPDNPEP